jgi:hypothetical protein
MHFSSLLKDDYVTKQNKTELCNNNFVGVEADLPVSASPPLDTSRHHRLHLEVIHEKTSVAKFI